ncbi:acyl carrier protein, partial [Streptomyces xinghaiensis]
LTSTAEAWAHGATLTWDPALPPGHLTTLPTYPFNHHHYWLDTIDGGGGDDATQEKESGPLTRELRGLPSSQKQLGFLLDLVCRHTAVVLGLDTAAEVDPDLSFKKQGIQSMTGVELRNRLLTETGLALPTTLVYDRPTPRALAQFLHTELLDGSPSGSVLAPAQKSFEAQEPIAVVGMGCRFPGGVGSPEALWRLVVEGVDAVSPFPGDR